MANFVYSTLTADQLYVNYQHGASGIPIELSRVFIKGGANIPAMKTLITPLGVSTEVTDEQLEHLKLNPVFNRHKEKGFITVLNKKADADAVATDMNGRDASAPDVEADAEAFEKSNNSAKLAKNRKG